MQSEESTEDSEQETPTAVKLTTQSVSLIPKEGVADMAVSIKVLKERMEKLADFKKEILTDSDFATFKTKDGKEIKAIRKSGCLKYAVAFNLTTVVAREEKMWIDKEKNKYAWHVVTQCIAPNGRLVEEIGVCDNVTDRPEQPEHVIKSMAKTRGTSRAIIGMVGTAETPAEEMSAVKGVTQQTQTTKDKLCTCSPEERIPSDVPITSSDSKIHNLLNCKHCSYPISRMVSDSIIKKRESNSSS